MCVLKLEVQEQILFCFQNDYFLSSYELSKKSFSVLLKKYRNN